MLSTEKSFKMFPKHKGYLFISESFALNWCTILALTNKNLLLPLQGKLKQNFLSDLKILIEYSVISVSDVLSSPFVCPLPKN